MNAPANDQLTQSTLPVIPIPAGVVLPGAIVTIALESPEAVAAGTLEIGELVLVPRHESGSFVNIGVRAVVEDRGTLPTGVPTVTLRVRDRVNLSAAVLGTGGGLWMPVEPAVEKVSSRTASLANEYRAIAERLLGSLGGERLVSALPEADNPSVLADTIVHWTGLSFSQRVQILETLDIDVRLKLAIDWAKEALADLEASASVAETVREDFERDQRREILRRQLRAIQEELDENGSGDLVTDYRSKVDALRDDGVDPKVIDALSSEVDRLERTTEQSTEYGWIRAWLDAALGLPLGVRADTETDISRARSVLERDHFGLGRVKDAITEHLSVSLRRERLGDRAGERSPGGSVLALVGPPGVGKTSLGRSIAEAMGRPFGRIALGGTGDESEIRGHRRTYVGARPGRIARALTEAGAMNPVLMLDEIDKVGADWRGDVSSALLEVLDPAQNHTFRDNYLEFDLDLSEVVFVATANYIDRIPAPLQDRLEVITLEGYTDVEKFNIARQHLLPRILREAGLAGDELALPEGVLKRIIDSYTDEAGVRGLERQLRRIARKAVLEIEQSSGVTTAVAPSESDLEELLGRPRYTDDLAARTDRPGVAVGLAVTGAGGDTMVVEAAEVPGEAGLTLTGQLGDVMKESGEIARSLLLAHAADLRIDDGEQKRIHVHFPAGAIPKDGPSAGVAMTVAMASLLTGRRARSDVGMTGEVSLHGKVLPIGGVKQKVLAAARAELTTVILPRRNEVDLRDLPEEVTNNLELILIDDISEALELVLEEVSMAH